MASRKQSLEKLRVIFKEHESNKTDMVFRNMFATACYLSIVGEKHAGLKQLRSLFDWLGWNKRTTYFSAILESFSEFAPQYASEIFANHEVNEIFKNLIKK